MKIIVFGLGNFGMSLSLSLTETGNEVIGIDKQMDKVNLVKDKISHAICMDSTNELAYEAVPLKDADKVVVAIGESEGAAIITTAIIKKLSDVKIISRALSPIHDTVLEAMGIHSIIHPEQESADRLTKQINFKSTLENYQLDDNFTISEVKARNEFFGKSLEELDSIDKYHLTLVTIIRKKEKRNLIGKKSLVKESIGRPSPDTIVEEGDILVVYGNNKDIEKLEKFMSSKPVAEQEIGHALLQEVVGYAETSMNRRKYLLHYFGENFDEINFQDGNQYFLDISKGKNHNYKLSECSKESGESVLSALNLALELAKENKIKADIVVPVPDSGNAAALGFAQHLGVNFELGLIRNHYVGRTFIEPSQKIRSLGVKLKLNANQSTIKGKRIILIDDSLVRGTTSHKIVKMLYDAGAKEVHVKNDSGLRYPRSVIYFKTAEGEGKHHPTQKPIDLYRWLIRTFSNEGDLVLDPCMGGGTTGIASRLENRNFIGIEREKEYYEIAKKRIEDAVPVEEVVQGASNPLVDALY